MAAVERRGVFGHVYSIVVRDRERLDIRADSYYTSGMKAARVLLLSCALGAPAAAAPKAAPGAALAYVAGAVTVETKAGSRPGRRGEALADGDAVASGPGATAVIALADGSKLKLKESSRIALTLPGSRAPTTDVLLSLGGVFAKVAKRLPGAEFRVRTPTAVAAVRGTRFFTAYGRAREKSRDLWVCVDEGRVDVNTDAAPKALGVPAGKGVLIKSGLDLTKPQAYDWTKKLNWNMDPDAGAVEDKTDLDSAYADLLDQDYR